MKVERGADAPADWDAYCAGHPRSTACHAAAAVAIGRRAFGLRTWYLGARRADGTLAGVLPLVEQSSLAFGRFLVSVPFLTYGGLLADDAAAAHALVESAADLARERRARHVELRHTARLDGLTLPERTDKVSMVLPLPGDEVELGKRLGSKLRSQIRRAERENPEVRWGGAELVPDFYRVFAPGMHELGTPVHPPRFFELAMQAFGDRARILVLAVDGVPQAAALTLRHGAAIEVPWAAATPAAKRGALNMRLYWEMLRAAVAAGADAFDFGRCTVDSGTHRFKAQWGAQPVQLYWHYWLASGGPLPVLNAANPKYALAVSLWRRMPLWCANTLGPLIARSLP